MTVIDLADSAEIGTTGETIAVKLPSGIVLDLWLFEREGDTCSIDVRARDSIDDVNGLVFRRLVRTFPISDNVGVVVVA